MLPRRFGGKVTPKVIGDKSVAFNHCSLFEINLLLGWLRRRDLIDMWFKLVLIQRSKLFFFVFPILSLLSFKHVTNYLPYFSFRTRR